MFWQSLIKTIDLRDNLDSSLSLFVNEARRLLSVDACSVFILDHTNIYTLCASTLAPSLKSGMIYVNVLEDIIGTVALREEALAIPNTCAVKKHNLLRTLSREIYYSLLAAPVIYKSKVIAIVVFQKVKKNKISESLQTNVATLCANLSLPLNKAMQAQDVSGQIQSGSMNTLFFSGIIANEGVQKGKAFARYNITDIEDIPDKITQVDDEESIFVAAVRDVRKSLKEMLERMQLLTQSNEAEVFESYLQIMNSSRFYDAIINYIRDGIWLQTAIKKVVLEQAAIFEQMDETYFTARASDIRDLGKRILLSLEDKTPKKSHYPFDTVLVASEITASMIAEVPKGRLMAVVTEHGSSYSHAAIIAKGLSVPFVTGIKALPVSFIDGKEIIVDAYVGRVYIDPSHNLKSAYDRLIRYESQKASELQAMKNVPSITLDGCEILLQANISLIADLEHAIKQGASSIGLYRSEIPFMIREHFPSEDEQRIIYQQILETFPHDPVVLRILDVGADKALPYFHEFEQNPALGWRGIRMMLDQTNLFLMQVRAMLKASAKYYNLRILLPMVTTLEEIRDAKKLILQAYKEVVKEGYDIKIPDVGVMIEVPSTILMLKQIMPLIDFLSIGSNDLTQYILAVDRSNDKVSSLYSQHHPAMIRLFYYLARISKKYKKDISLCGEIGGNPLMTPLLIGMGFYNLSMHPSVLLKIKYVIRNITRKQCQNVLKQVLQLATTKEIHSYLENFLIENDLGRLIKAGK